VIAKLLELQRVGLDVLRDFKEEVDIGEIIAEDIR